MEKDEISLTTEGEAYRREGSPECVLYGYIKKHAGICVSDLKSELESLGAEDAAVLSDIGRYIYICICMK